MEQLINDIRNYIPVNDQESKDKELFLELLDSQDNIFNRKNKVCHITASCWITNQDFTKVLMAYHNIYNSWAWLGGHADDDHNLKHVALKEAKEESGLSKIKLLSEDIASLEILCVQGHYKHGEYVSDHLHLNITYLLVADENEMLQHKADENSAVAWFKLDEAPSMSNEQRFKEVIYPKLNNRLKALKANRKDYF